MIALVRGRLARRDPAGVVVVDCGAIGYRVFVSLNTLLGLPETGAEVTLHTATIVREDAFHLYGFSDLEEMALFNLLLQVKGIGPRLALALLGGMKAADLRAAIRRADAGWISTVPGVGRKTAERIILELKDKVGAQDEVPAPGAPLADERMVSDAVSALANLGYRAAESRSAVRGVLQEGASATLDELIRSALKRLSGRAG